MGAVFNCRNVESTKVTRTGQKQHVVCVCCQRRTMFPHVGTEEGLSDTGAAAPPGQGDLGGGGEPLNNLGFPPLL